MQWEYRQPVVIHFGNGKLAQLSDEIDALEGSAPCSSPRRAS